MKSFNFQKNEVTGLMQANFTAKLISISNSTKTNTNGKEYRVASIKFVDANDVEQTISALMYEKNYSKGVEVNNEYLATVTIMPDNQPLVTVSHLQGAERATINMFGIAVETPVTA